MAGILPYGMQIAAIDFDGVIYQSKGIWRGPSVIDGVPTDECKAALREIRKTHYIVVYSCRATSEPGKKAIEEWLKANDIKFDAVTNVKPHAQFYLDDRAIRFEGWSSFMDKWNGGPWA